MLPAGRLRESWSVVLTFSSGDVPELETFEAFPPSGESIQAARGKPCSSRGDVATFQWTSAVRALSVLLLRHFGFEGQSQMARLQGDRRSLAASLDYALSKEPIWLLDLFGLDESGYPLAKSVIKRVNPELKRPGPVFVFIESSLLPHSSICVRRTGKELSADEAIRLARLLSESECSFKMSNSDTASNGILELPSLFCEPSSRREIANAIYAEVDSMLRRTHIFSERSVADYLKSIAANRLFAKVATRPLTLFDGLETIRCPKHKLGLSLNNEALKPLRSKSLTIAVGAAAFPVLAILLRAKKKWSVPLEIDFHFENTRTLVNRLIAKDLPEPPAACAVSISCAAILLKQRRLPYRPLMLLPSTSHRLVSNSRTERKRTGKGRRYIFITDELTTSSLYMEGLFQDGNSKLGRIQKFTVAQDEVARYFQCDNDELHSVLWFPHYFFNERYNGLDTTDIPATFDVNGGNILFVHTDILSDRNRRQVLDVLIRDAWMDLVSSPQMVRAHINGLLDDPIYSNYLYRTSGLHNFSECIKRFAQ